MKKLSEAFLPLEYPYKHLEAIFQIGNPNCFDIFSDQTDLQNQGVQGVIHESLELFQSPHIVDLDGATPKSYATTNFRLESTGGFVSIIRYQLADEPNPLHSSVIIVIGHAYLNEDSIPEQIYPHFLMTASVIGDHFIPRECKCIKITEDKDGVEHTDLHIAQNAKEFQSMICYANDAFENVMAGYLPEVENYQQWIDPESFFDPERTYKRLCKRTPQSLTEDIKNGESDGNSQIVEDNILCFPPPMMQ